MTKQIINVGSGELTGDGESIRSAFVKINENFDETYAGIDTINNAGYLTTATLPPYPVVTTSTLYAGTYTAVLSTAGQLTFQNGTSIGTNSDDNILVTGNLIPNNNFTLGTTSTPWTKAYVGPRSLEILPETSGGVTIVLANNNDTLNVTAGGFAVNDATAGFSTFKVDPLGYVTIRSEDSTSNPPLTVLGYGTTSPIAPPSQATLIHGVGQDGNPAQVLIDVFSDVISDSVNFRGRTARGTHASPLAVESEDYLAAFSARGYDGTEYGGASSLQFVATENFTTSAQGTALSVNLTPPGTTTPVKTLQFNHDGITIYPQLPDTIGANIKLTNEILTVSSAGFAVYDPTQTFYSFQTDVNGRSFFNSPIASAQTVVEINGSSLTPYPFAAQLGGSLIHATAAPGAIGFIDIDSFSNVPTAGGGAYVARRFRGTPTSPLAVQSGDYLLNLIGSGYHGTGFRSGVGSARIIFKAQENFTLNSQAAYTEFRNQVPNNGTEVASIRIDSSGIVLPNVAAGGTGNAGITFTDGSFQSTAFNATNAVTKIQAGNGITVSTSTGIVGIDATGVQNVLGTPNRVIVSDSGAKNLTLTTPQDLATTSSVTFQNITVTGNLNVIGTQTVATNAVVQGKILYLANSATNISQIDGGGIQLGTGTFAKSILYSQANNWWDTDGAGMKTLQLDATTGSFDTLLVNTKGKFGVINQDNNYANAALEVDADVNSFSQIVNINHNTGTNASADYIAVNDIGNDSANYIDLGINSSVYTNPDYSITGPNDGYLFVNGGNLVIGTQSTGTNIVFHTGGTTSDRLRVTISDAGLTVIGTLNGLTLPSTSTTAGYVLSNNGSGVTSWVQPQTGYVGSRGGTGYAGSRGTDGVVGLTGYTGSQGIQGNIGFTGSKGDQGSLGYTGSKGDTGAIGNTGTTGFTGSKGDQGGIGFTGSKGDQGVIGFTGFTGSVGSQGGIGFTGSVGAQGVVGFTGSKGDQGSPGYTGSASTVAGYTGSQGSTGGTGFTGSAGAGFTGSKGDQGSPGYTGSIGYSGSTGVNGITSISTGTGIFVSTSTGAVTISLNTSTLMNQAVSLVGVTSVLQGTLSVDFASVAKNSASSQTFTITGLTTGHHIIVQPAAAMTYGLIVTSAWASATNTVTIQVQNLTNGAIDQAAINVDYFAWVQ